MKAVLIINAGSSSIKFAIYEQEQCRLLYKGSINNLLEAPLFKAYDNQNQLITENPLPSSGHTNSIKELGRWIELHAKEMEISAIGHRVVHGGRLYSHPVIITNEVMTELENLIPLAPLHQPYNIEAIKIMISLFPDAAQVACFDTAFHSTIDQLAKTYAIPRKYTAEGIIRYGFHGLSYEYIASILPDFAEEKADGKIIIAHLGNGSSMCAIHKRKSVATTMGFTALEGLMMGTRAGSIDPGIILYLQQHHKLSIDEVEHLLYKESGLLGVSGISNDMEVLHKSDNPNAKEAIDLFCYRASQSLAMLTASLQGLDALIFTAGIGENCISTRKQICELSAWLGINIDELANSNHKQKISLTESPIAVYVIPTDEELMIAKHTLKLIPH
jgi:acetate kinase